MVKMRKKAWISVLESFIAVTLIMLIVTIIIEQNILEEKNSSEDIFLKETGILRGIEFNDTMRSEILAASLPIYLNSSSFPASVKAEIGSKKPAYLNCTAKICGISSVCTIDENIDEEIYAQSVFISANATDYSPRELKIFCWEK